VFANGITSHNVNDLQSQSVGECSDGGNVPISCACFALRRWEQRQVSGQLALGVPEPTHEFTLDKGCSSVGAKSFIALAGTKAYAPPRAFATDGLFVRFGLRQYQRLAFVRVIQC
jgi:hypothetical protein